MKNTLIAISAALVTLSAVVVARQATEPVDLAMIAKIKDEGLNRSQVGAVFDMFVNVIGPRLTGSPEHKRAADYASETMTKWGLSNVHLESWPFGRGWALDKLTIEMVEPRYFPLVGYAEAWTPSTSGELVVTALSTAGKSAEEVARMPIAGAAILQSAPVTNFIVADRVQPATQPDGAPFQTGAPTGGGRGNAGAAVTGAAVLIKPSRGDYGTVFVQAGSGGPGSRPATTPAIVLMGEQYNMIARLLEHHVVVKLRVNVQTHFLESDLNSYNVIADIPGTDPALKDQIVLLGGHLDSWHTGTGATDNADGAAVVMEAFRILKAIGARPKRTIRVAIWSGEEEGLFGSKAYVADHLAGDAHKAERDKFDVYFNIDPGRGPIYGWYLENNDAVKPIFDAWLAPFRDLGALKNVRPGIPSTDHLSFIAVGLPGFNPIQDYVDYDTRLHHTNVDTFERVSEQDLKQNAIVLASFVYHSAMRAEMIPSATRK